MGGEGAHWCGDGDLARGDKVIIDFFLYEQTPETKHKRHICYS